MALTAAARRIVKRMSELASDRSSEWAYVPNDNWYTVRLTRTHETPEHHRGIGWGRWPEATYESYTFLTVAGGKAILGVAAAPWVGRTDSAIPFWLAEAILADADDLGQDMVRIRELRQARKAGGAV